MTESVHSADGKGNGHAKDDPLAKRVAEGPRGGARTWYDVLEVAPDVGAADLKKAYDRALALVEGRSIGGYLMLDPLAAESARADVEAAYAVLGDPERRRAYDEKLAKSGEEPTARPTERNERVERGASEKDGGDEDQRNAREMLAIENAQKSSPSPTEPPPRTTSSPGLKFTAPAEPSEEVAASPSRPTPKAPAFSGGDPRTPGASSAIKFDVPKTSPGAIEEAPARRIVLAEPVDDVPMSPTMTIPPEAAMPSPSGSGSSPPAPASSTATSAKGDALPESGDIPGALIRELREGKGLTLDDLAEATKIRKPYLRAIEEEDMPNLPARVYLRGFLTQIGRVLKVDRTRLAEGYLTGIEKKGAPGA